jgi:hypothetical protein
MMEFEEYMNDAYGEGWKKRWPWYEIKARELAFHAGQQSNLTPEQTDAIYRDGFEAGQQSRLSESKCNVHAVVEQNYPTFIYCPYCGGELKEKK